MRARFLGTAGQTTTNAGSSAPVSSVFLWLDATKNVSVAGSDVTTWGDQSGNGYNVTSGIASGAAAPTYNATGWLGTLPTIAFDGTQGLNRVGLGGSSRTIFSFCAVVQPVGAYDNEDAIWFAPANADWSLEAAGMYCENSASVTESFDIYAQGSGAKGNSGLQSLLADRPQVICATYDGITVNTYINGELKGSTAYSGGHIGDRMAIATLLPGYSGYNWTAKISEILWAERAFSSDEVATLQAYCKAKWFSSLWAGNTGSMTFDGATRLTAGTVAALDYTLAQKKIFGIWAYIPSTSTQKASLFCREKTSASFNGYDFFISTTNKLSWYAAHSFSGDCLLVGTSASIPTDRWVYLSMSDDGSGTAAGITFEFDGVDQTKAVASIDNLVGTINDPTLKFYMGDAHLDSGGDFFIGKLTEAFIGIGQTGGASYVNTYLIPNKYPGNVALAPGAAHWWKLNGDLLDSIGTAHMTVEAGTATFTTARPSL